MNTWRYDIRTWYPEEATTFIGNGFVGGNLPIDGHGAGGNPYAAKMAAHYVRENEQFVGVPHWLDISLSVAGKVVRPKWVGFTQSLDLREGKFATSYLDRQDQVRVTTETFCHRVHKGVAVYTMTIEALTDVEVDIRAQLSIARCDGRPKATALSDLPAQLVGWDLDWGDANAKVSQFLSIDGLPESRQSADEQSIAVSARLTLKAGAKRVVTGVVTCARGATPAAEARKLSREHLPSQYEELAASHVQAMERLWADYSIRVGNPYMERRANASMFYLLCGYRDDVVWGGSATGLSSKGSWGGSVLWDTEFYMLPAMLPFFPKLVKNMLLYRHATLTGAQENARRKGEKGARFAWQSKVTGLPFGGPFEEERHVSSDVAFACDWYRRVAGDQPFHDQAGRVIIAEVARNWASRAIEAKPGRWEIHGVIPPDEHVWDHYRGQVINNSAMTNAYAGWVLQTAAEDRSNDASESERKLWRAIAQGIHIPRDEAQGIYLEYDGYDGHPIKQADVGHLFFPLCLSRDPAEIRRNIRYYADRDRETGLFLTHSPFVYGAALSRAGDVAGVQRCFEMTNQTFTGPFEIPRESNYATGPVTTGAGSFVGLLMYAALGIENTGGELTSHACVSEETGSVEASHVLFGGRRHRVRAVPGQTHATIESE